MSSNNAPTVDSIPLTSRLKQPPQPKKWPILSAEPPSKNYSIRGEKTPVGLRANLKSASDLPPVPDYNQPEFDAWREFGNIHAFDEQDLPQESISDWSQVHIEHHREDRYHGRSASPPPSTSFPPPFEFPTPTIGDPVAREVLIETSAEQERRHRRMEGAFARLFLKPQGARQQEGYGGGAHPNVQVHQPFSPAQQDANSRQQQQQQLSQLQQRVFTPHEQFPQIQEAVAPQQQQQRIPQVQQAVVPQQQQLQVQQNASPRKQQQQPQQFSFAQDEAVLRQLQQLQLQQQQVSQAQQVAQTVAPQQQQHQLPQVQQVVVPQHQQQQQQQQQPQPPVEVQPGLYLVYDPATQGYKYACDPLQNHGGRVTTPSEVTKPWADSPKYPKSESKSINTTLEDGFPAAAHKRYARLRSLVHNEEQKLLANQARMLSHGSSGTSSEHRQGLSPSHGDANLVEQSEIAADAALEVPQLASLGPNTVSSIEADEALQSLIPTERMSMPTASPTAVSIFSEFREGLESLQADIEDLSDGSDSFTESSGSDSETNILSGRHSDHTTNNVREEPGAGSTESQDLRANTEETASSSGSSPAHKRSQLDDTNEDHARAQVGVSRKRTKLSSLRFICCFHNGPGRKCSGTDGTISEVLKKLSEQNNTHVCDRCWILKIKDDSSGLFVHPDDSQACLDHFLSPQCHKITPTVGHRHLFDPKTCGTKPSRVRPGDSEAVYRFIFRLVHPDLDCPSSVLTAERSLHLDAVPRQSRRKLNREELTARANDLEKRLEHGEQENRLNASRITQLQQDFAAAHQATKTAEEKNAALEKQTRRITAMLSDALRTGLFKDLPEHQSLLRRVKEDAPGALVHQQQSLLTPPASDRSRNSSATPFRADVAGQDISSRPAAYEGPTHIAPLGTLPIDQTRNEYMSNPWPSDSDVDPAFIDIFDEPGESDVINLQEAQHEFRFPSLPTPASSTMNTPTQVQSAPVESRIQDAVAAYKSGTYRLIRAAANAFSIPPSTLSYRLAGRTSRSQAHESEQILSHAEEKTLVRWLTRLTSTGFPASPALAIEMAEEIRLRRLQLSKTLPLSLRPVGNRWIDRFTARHPDILSVWTRQIERARHDATSSEALETWFDAVTELRIAHHYPPERIYNMEESGFAVGASQSSKALVSVREKSSWKVIAGRQEWITAIECWLDVRQLYARVAYHRLRTRDEAGGSIVVSVFSPLKRALAAEIDAVARLDASRVSRVELTQMYIRARDKAFTATNIKSGWRNTGLEPLSPIVVLDKYR
ncbi:hypothetical protein Q7P35_006718 [Cladosporium inversicolor]